METEGPRFVCYCFWRHQWWRWWATAPPHSTLSDSTLETRQRKLRRAGRKSPFKTKSCCRGNHRRGEQGKISSVLSFRQITVRITSKVKSTAYDLPRPHSCISIKNYSTGNTASHCTVTMRHFRGLSKRVNKKMLAHGMEKRHKVAIRFMLIT